MRQLKIVIITILIINLNLISCSSQVIKKNKNYNNENNTISKRKNPIEPDTKKNPVKSETREEKILKQYSDEKSEKYSEYLVNPKNYTTANGATYQKRYYKYLIALAGDIAENKKLKMIPGSIGYYFDNKSDNKRNLYFGVDIFFNKNFGSYSKSAIILIKKYLVDILNPISSCTSMFKEKQIIGMVIGFRWKGAGYEEMINLWIKKDDFLKFQKKLLTFSELIQKSTITNTSGEKIILRL
jgi:hypothetical protein